MPSGMHFRLPECKTNIWKFSFIPEAIKLVISHSTRNGLMYRLLNALDTFHIRICGVGYCWLAIDLPLLLILVCFNSKVVIFVSLDCLYVCKLIAYVYLREKQTILN